MKPNYLIVLAALASTLLGCRIPNEAHCGRQDGDATCSALDSERPYCSICEALNDGCVESIADIPADCRPSGSIAGDTETGTTSTGSSESGSESESESESESGSESGASTDTTSTETGLAPMCGDGIKHEDEQCDGDDFGDASCADPYDLPEGTLTCIPDECVISTTDCCLADGEVCLPGECCDSQCNPITNKCGL